MKIVIAKMSQETSSFSPVPTLLKDFGPGAPLEGKAAYDAVRSSGYSIAGMLAVAEEIRAVIDVPLSAVSATGAPAPAAVFDYMADKICAGVARGCDAVMLDLHGAMMADSYSDAEGELLERIRKIAPGIPIAVALDLHGTLTDRMVKNCTVMVGYKTSPHVDMRETGEKAARLLIAAMRKEIQPVIEFVRIPIAANAMRASSDESPTKDFIAKAVEAEAKGALAVNFFRGFALADVPESGMSVVAVTDGDREAARRICTAIADEAWQRREEFVDLDYEPLSASITRAKAAQKWPVLLVDPSDGCNSGGSQDTMGVIAEALKQGLTDIAAGPVCDPAAVEQLIAAGVGAKVTLDIGGKASTPTLPAKPLRLSGVVRAIVDAKFTVTGPVFNGKRIDLGRTVLFDTGDLELLVSEGRCEPLDLRQFRIVGVEPTAKKFVVVKSKSNFWPTFGAIAAQVVECHAPGAAAINFGALKYNNLPSHTYPLPIVSQVVSGRQPSRARA